MLSSVPVKGFLWHDHDTTKLTPKTLLLYVSLQVAAQCNSLPPPKSWGQCSKSEEHYGTKSSKSLEQVQVD